MEDSYALSPTQQGMLFHALSGAPSDVDVEQVVCTLREELDVDMLERAWQHAIHRHACLRTCFRWQDRDEQVQLVARDARPSFEHIRAGGIDNGESDRVSELADFLAADRSDGFDLNTAPLIRLALFTWSDASHTLVWTFHHIVVDGRSQALILRDVFHVYDALQGGPDRISEPGPAYRTYIDWLETRKDTGAAREYWTNYLAGFTAPTPFAIDKLPSAPVGRGENRRACQTNSSAETVATLEELARENGITLNTLVQGAWSILLHRYSGEEDVVFGAIRACRSWSSQAASITGTLINTLPVRVRVSAADALVPWLRGLRTQHVSVRDHEHAPLADIQKWSDVPGRRSLFESILIYDHQSLDHSLRSSGGAWENRQFELHENTGYPLTLYVYGQPNLTMKLDYDRHRFDDAAIERMLGHLLTVLEEMAAGLDRRVGSLPILTERERRQLLVEWNSTDVAYPRTTCIHQLFEAQAQRTPDAIALVFENRHLTYRDLHARADQLAHRLRSSGVGPEVLVGVYMGRSLEMVVALLGILKAGGAYVPLDPTYPKDRLAFMLEDSRLPVVVAEPNLIAGLPDHKADVIALDPEFACVDGEPADTFKSGVTSDSLAYVIYTSGSTGNPKGVMIRHRNVVNFFAGMDPVIDHASEPRVWFAVTSISFDISVLELFWTLTRGFKVVLQTDDKVASTRRRDLGRGVDRPLDFSLFYFAAGESEGTREKYRLLLDGARFADENGFTAVWTPERHFHAFGGLYPNPSVASAAIAAVTKNIQIRAGSVVLPLHSPIRVAEEWALVDNLSDGRVGLSFASGWQTNDFVLAADNHADRKEIMFRDIDTVKKLWRGEEVIFPGVGGQDVKVRTLPRPVQSELPFWVTAGGSPETFRRAGETGARLLTHLLGQSSKQLAEKIAVYREAYQQQSGGKGRGHVTLMLHTFVGDDHDAVREVVREPFSNYLRTALDLVKIAPQAFPNFALRSKVTISEKGADLFAADDFTEEDTEALVAHAFDRYFETSGLFGTPDTCLEMLDGFKEIGVDEIACLIDFGVDPEAVLASLVQLAKLKEKTNETRATAEDRLSLAAHFERHDVTHLQCTPSMAKALTMEPESFGALGQLRNLFLGGEALPASLASRVREVFSGRLVNMYGPTETTVWSATQQVSDGSGGITVGRPIANTQIYILDSQLQPVPIGVSGEVFIAGDGVARGYLNRPELTAEKFLDDPFCGRQGALMYRTGDEARCLSDGTIDFIGRLDHQVKIRGYRIELGEIESALEKIPEVRQAIVLAREDTPGEKRLVGYVTTQGRSRPSVNSLQAALRERLPDFMVPSMFVFMETLPLTPNEKVNRRALPAPDTERPDLDQSFVAPRVERERAIAEVWSSVLGIERIGVTDNFFDLGGDSILAVQIVAKANQRGLQLTVRGLLDHQTVAELAALDAPAPAMAAEQGLVVGPVDLTPIQRWLLDQELPELHHYNQAMLLKLPAGVDSELLGEAVDALVWHHDALRMRFRKKDATWRQIDTDEGGPTFSVVDLSDRTKGEQMTALRALVGECQMSLDLAAGPVFRAIHIVLRSGERDRLLLVGHHLIIDGVSWRILLEDVQAAYRLLEEGRPVELPQKTTSFKEWAHGLTERAKRDFDGLGLEYWTSQIGQVTPLPVDFSDGENTEASASSVESCLTTEETSHLLHRVPEAYNTRVNDVLLTALAQAVSKWHGQPELLVDLEGHGREDIVENADISRTVGWFTSLFPVALELQSSRPVGDALKSVKAELRRIPGNGVGYGLLRYLGEDEALRDRLRSLPHAEIQFNYLGQFGQFASGQSMFEPAPEPPSAFARSASPLQPRPYLLEVLGIVADQRLKMTWIFSENIHKRDIIERLATDYMCCLRAIITYCMSKKEREFAPADFPLANLDQKKLDVLAARLRTQRGVRGPS